MPRILVLGPTKSGKSEWAEHLARQSAQSVTYVATSQQYQEDVDWQARIAKHRRRRPETWQTLEVPIALASVLATAPSQECWLVDSLGTWVTNQLDQDEDLWEQATAALLTAIADFSGTLIIVAEETGWGVVPAYPLGRTFRDRLGQLTRAVGSITDRSYLVVAGFAIDLNQVAIRVPSLSPNPFP